MKVLLCNNRTGLYYEPSGRWGAGREQAYDFGQTHAAIQFSADNGLTGVELVLTYGEPALDVRIPLERPSKIALAP